MHMNVCFKYFSLSVLFKHNSWNKNIIKTLQLRSYCWCCHLWTETNIHGFSDYAVRLWYNLSDIVFESPLIFLTFHNMQIDRNGLQFVRVALVLTTMIGIDLSQNGRRFESKQLFFIWKVLRTLGKWHNLPIFWQWSTISVPEKKS